MKKKKKVARRSGRRPAGGVPIEDRLRAYIAKHPGCSRAAAAQGLRVSYPYVTQKVAALRRQRVVIDDGKGAGLRIA